MRLAAAGLIPVGGTVLGRMPAMETDDRAGRARQRALVRRGYDAISLAYRSDDGQAAPASGEDVSRYAGWVTGLTDLLRPGAPVLAAPPSGPARQPGPRRHDSTASQARQPGCRGVLLCPNPRAARRPAGPVPPDPGLAAPWRALPGNRRRAAVDGHRALPRHRHVLGSRRHRHLPSLAPGSWTHTGLEPLHPRRRYRTQPHPDPGRLRPRAGVNDGGSVPS